MATTLKFEGPIHECIGFQEGDWLVFKCPVCPDYERRLNWRTGRFFTKIGPENGNRHTGLIAPPQYWTLDQNPN